MEETNKRNARVIIKNQGFFLRILLAFIILPLISFIIYRYYTSYIQKTNNLPDNQQITNQKTPEVSTFGRFIDEETNYSDQVLRSREPTFRAGMVGLSVFSAPEEEIKSYLPDNCIVLKKAEFIEDSPSFLLISSTDNQFNYKIGDNVDFVNYNISPQNVVILIEDGVYETLDILSSLDIHEIIKPGSRLVFSCSSPSCQDKTVSWVLFLIEDLNL